MKESVAYYSGDKNSAAMVHRLDALGKTPDNVVFADTGLEFPETYDTVEKFGKITGIEIIWEPALIKFEDWFYKPHIRGFKKGEVHGFPMTHHPTCGWMKYAKHAFLKWDKLCEVRYIGFASDETHRNKKGDYVYPLQEWGFTEEYSLLYCRKYGINNPLYDWGFPRLGCWLCPYQSKKSLRILKAHLERKSPESWEYLKKLEKDSPHGFKPDLKLSELDNMELSDFGLFQIDNDNKIWR
jgi:3'-phosphoadenosine 5'-phosphosulfate sulfotransferase (PAPS reductase)/FAD synthetase